MARELAGNMRLFEATGAGALLITEECSNLHELFLPNEEVATYRTASDVAERISALLSSRTVLEAMSRRGQQRTLKSHSSSRRTDEFLSIIESIVPGL
jgi:spore maturation protein CgeB